MLRLSERVKCLRERAYAWQETQTGYIGQRLFPALEELASSALFFCVGSAAFCVFFHVCL